MKPESDTDGIDIPNIAKCPKCKSINVDFKSKMMAHESVFFVQCTNCSHKSEPSVLIIEAIRNWNGR